MEKNSIDEKIKKLKSITSEFLFVEFYSHTNCEMWKILNEYTKFQEEKLVLHSLEEGFEKSLDLAIEQIERKKMEFENPSQTIGENDSPNFLVRPGDFAVFEKDETNGCYRPYEKKLGCDKKNRPRASEFFTCETLTKIHKFFPIQESEIDSYAQKHLSHMKF